MLEGKVVLITGASGGLGAPVTRAFLEAGATVIGVSRSIQASHFPHPAFTAMPAELAGGEAARSVADAVAARFGRIDVLAHLVGGFAGGEPVAETADATLERIAMLALQESVCDGSIEEREQVLEEPVDVEQPAADAVLDPASRRLRHVKDLARVHPHGLGHVRPGGQIGQQGLPDQIVLLAVRGDHTGVLGQPPRDLTGKGLEPAVQERSDDLG
ncbi:MAG: SDR family oxidoreductase, partial [Bryobacteraceae bacterium]|nr:SDR family oxidoreductase [Bryobacteraceae bacterium]